MSSDGATLGNQRSNPYCFYPLVTMGVTKRVAASYEKAWTDPRSVKLAV